MVDNQGQSSALPASAGGVLRRPGRPWAPAPQPGAGSAITSPRASRGVSLRGTQPVLARVPAGAASSPRQAVSAGSPL